MYDYCKIIDTIENEISSGSLDLQTKRYRAELISAIGANHIFRGNPEYLYKCWVLGTQLLQEIAEAENA